MAVAVQVSAQSEAEFQAWLTDFKQQAKSQGISQPTLDMAFADVHLNHKVLELDQRQPEFTRTFWQYFEATVTDWRINKGIELYEENRTLLDNVTQKYGVPGRFLVAFWGMETNYGGFTGNIPIIEALATLAYNPRRSEFFSDQLIYALRILDEGHVPLKQMKGSWAGAMGQTQFMPYNYLRYSVDGDNSGHKDLWNSLPDVFHSSGNFLNKLGWNKEENWGREVQLPAKFDYALADGSTRRPLSEWREMGITLADGRPIPNIDMKAALLMPSDYRGPVFLVYDNFFVIKRWNNSNSYALAVGHLADRLIGREPLVATKPSDDEALSKQHISELQRLLRRLGYKSGGIDGVAGTMTRQAIRDFQIDRNIPADGFPSMHLLKILREAVH
ncbi:lytic murein transglycosylase [Thiomicrospira pelophila]|uniref:lytic murein transglycosylase n=1 Tax=Thiomicrospira pelophila TaxID=934 RepID=UPI000A7AF1F1|nr:lytic murein transglycosylase [Thiomicrospira pelophila]